ncbi:MAG: tetratricopeptide repeat protein [Ignavibacteria bacterium]|nr:tetratricopeptide repeat protein [Ignavibacteria bacterium]
MPPANNNSAKASDFDSLWNYNDPAATETKFREILPQIKESGNISEYLQLLTQIARTLGLRRMFDESHKLLDEVEPQLNDSLPKAKVRYLLERGRTFNSSDKISEARELFLQAYDLAASAKEDNLAVDAAHMMGIVESDDKSVEWNEKAMEIAEASSDPKANKWLGSLYNNLGWTYFEMKQYERALDLFRKDAVWYEQNNVKNYVNVAHWSAAKTLRMMGKTDEALNEQLRLLELFHNAKADEDGYVYEELAECYLIKNNAAEAAKYAGLAYDILSKDIWMEANEKDRLNRLKDLGGK